jgi:hypothetical protein
MLTRRAFAGILAASAVGLPTDVMRRAVAAAAESRRAEVDALRAFAEATHPRGCKAAADSAWQARWDELAKSADALTDGAYVVHARRNLGWFRDGHTTVLPFEFTGGVPTPLAQGPFRLHLPVRIRVFPDGARIVAADATASGLLGARIERIGQVDVGALIREVARDWPGNDAWAHRWSGAMLSSPALLEGLGAIATADASVALACADAAGRTQVRTVTPYAGSERPQRVVELPLTDREQWAGVAKSGNYVRPLAEHRALYVSIDDMGDVDGTTFAALTRQVFTAVEDARWSRIVIDLRRNGGGDNYLGEPLRKYLERSRCNRPGGLYVLIGPATFSAAQNLANRLERETYALFVGEPTGGSPNHYGDAQVFTGKSTGMTAIVSSLPWFDSYPQDARPWILPDLPVPDSYADRAAGRDAALALALGHESGRGADDLAPDRTFYFERGSQKQPWEPFWRRADVATA